MLRTSIALLMLVALSATAWAQDTPRASMTRDGLVLEKMAFGTGINEHELTGQAENFAAGDRVYCWTLMTGGKPGDSVTHVWFLDGEEVQSVELAVDAPYWRTWSYKTLFPGMSGSWKVEIRDAQGTVLGSGTFTSGE